MATKVVFITTTGSGTYTIPNDFSSLVSIEAIGGGGGSASGGSAVGGGGGAYAKTTSVSGLTAGNIAYYSVGIGGENADGTDTWFNAVSNNAPTLSTQGVLAKAGTTTAGGFSASSVGTVRYAGGSGGASTNNSRGGGGGAAGPGGAGKNGSAGGNPGAGQTSGGGGGGAGGGNSTAGTSATGSSGGSGGFGPNGTGSGAGATNSSASTAGTNGGGGGGGFGATYGSGADGGAGVEWISTLGETAGAGGGGGGRYGSIASNVTNGLGGLYGGGASASTSAVGGQGIIVFTYTSTITTRLFSTGNLLVNGIFDEVTQMSISTKPETVLAASFDEVTGMSATDGLIFYVDPGKSASYVGAGTKIRDIQTTTTIGTTQASPTYTATAPGYFTYNGTTQYIDFGNVSLAEVQDKTAMGWIYLTSDPAGVAAIIDKEFDVGGTSYGGWGFWAGPITGGTGLWFWAQSNKDLKDTTVLSLNTWYHVAVVWNYASKSATFYVNGVVTTTQTNATIDEKTSDSTTLKIGAMRSLLTGRYPGRIGAVQVYNRQFSAAEILNNYNADATRYGYTPTAPVPVKRDTSTGNMYITGIFDEVTGAR